MMGWLQFLSVLLAVSAYALTYTANDWLVGDLYDANGNTTNSAGNVFRYDAENRLTNAIVGGTNIIIVYDGDGNRVRKTVVAGTTTNTTWYLVDNRNLTGYAQVLEEHVSLNAQPATLNRVYNYGLDLISQREVGGTVYYFIYDGHGSTRALTTTNAAVANVFAYDAYGTLIASNGVSQTAYLYCGEQFDPQLGFYYLRARYLNTGTGRFWTRDSFEGHQSDPLSLHKYLYAHANPVMMTDPSGHFSIVNLTVNAAIKGTIAAFTFGAVSGAFTYAKTRSLEAAMFSAGQTAAITYLAFVSPAAAVSLGIGGAGAIGLGIYSGDITWEHTPEFAAYAAVGIGLSIAFRQPAFLEFGAATTVSVETAAAAGVNASRMMTVIGKLRNWDWSTPKDKAVFYSGPGNRGRASTYAKNNGALTIEETAGGRALMADADFLALSKTEQYAVWRAASLYYAQSASGRVTAFVNGSRAEGVFRTVEEPILRANMQRNIVTRIEYAQ